MLMQANMVSRQRRNYYISIRVSSSENAFQKYPDGNMREPLDELSQRRYDKHIKRITNKIRNNDFHKSIISEIRQ